MKWLKKDIQVIRDNCDKTSLELTKLLNRSNDSIRKKAKSLGIELKNNRWSKKDIKFMFDNCEFNTAESMGKLLNRTKSAIQSKANKENIHFKIKRNNKLQKYSWTIEEDSILKNMALDMQSTKQMSKVLNRTVNGIQHRASRLCININNYGRKTHEHFISEISNRGIKILNKYKSNNTILKCVCTVCSNIWYPKATTILQGHGCPCCAIDPTKPKYTYLLYFEGLDLYKVGISNNIHRRQQEFNIESELIFYRYFENGRDAFKLEQHWLANIKHLKIDTRKLRSGNTETFKYNTTVSV